MTPAPKLSLILVARDHQAFIRRSLRSILDQSFRDLEVIVVDDASVDHTPQILAEIASSDDRLRVERLEERHGVGPARDRGLDLSSGSHIWFVDAADYLPAGALAAAAQHLSSDLDVLVVRHVERDPIGTDHPPAIETAHVIWNKVIRRDHLRSLDARFGAGRFSEVFPSLAVTLTAERTAKLSQVAYCRVRLADRVNKAWIDGSPFDVFARYDQVFELVDSRTTLRPDTRRTLLLGMLRHYRTLLYELPEQQRAEFFREMARSLRAHRASETGLGDDRAERMLVAALESGHYHVYQATRRAVGMVRTRIAKPVRGTALGARRQGSRARSWLLRRYYAASRRRPLDPHLAVYSAYWDAAYACNPKAIFEKAQEIAPWIRGVWVVRAGSVHVLPSEVPYVIPGTRAYYRALARATYLVNNVNFPNDLRKRPGQIHVQTHHGTPLKHMGADLAKSPVTRLRMDFRKLMQRAARWDISISANAFTTEIWERVYPTGTYESWETGYPRNDVMVNATDADAARVRSELGIEPGRTVVLYAPTHREYDRTSAPFLDARQLAADLGPEFVILMRTHYLIAAEPARPGEAGQVLDVSSHPSIEDLCIASDVLVTDYSSVMFDYAVLDRPLVIHAPDWDVYRAIRGVYFDLTAEPPGAVTTSQDEVAQVLRTRSAWSESNSLLRTAFRAKYCSLEDGKAAERVVRRLWPAE